MKEEFAKKIISDLKDAIGIDGSKFDKNTPTAANKSIADSISTYLTENVTITISYVGTIPGPPPVPDPVVTDTMGITGTCAPPVGTDFDTWIKSLETNIVSGFLLDKGDIGLSTISPSPAFLPGLVLSREDIKSVCENLEEGDNIQEKVWEEICDKIIGWLELCNIGITYPGNNSNSGSTGIVTISKTTIT